MAGIILTQSEKFNKEYKEWLKGLVYQTTVYNPKYSYIKLFDFLYDCVFLVDDAIPLDENRASDGLYLRYQFAETYNYSDREVVASINKPCTILEMMVALSMRIEHVIMDDPQFGNRAPSWFWCMVASLGLGGQDDISFDYKYCLRVISNFTEHKYKPNGEGGLFTVSNPNRDMRTVEIWWQANYYLNEVLES